MLPQSQQLPELNMNSYNQTSSKPGNGDFNQNGNMPDGSSNNSGPVQYSILSNALEQQAQQMSQQQNQMQQNFNQLQNLQQQLQQQQMQQGMQQFQQQQQQNQNQPSQYQQQQQSSQQINSQHYPMPIIDEANPSIVYDRSLKVAKSHYSDHGTHGVAAVQGGDNGMMNGNGQNMGGMGNTNNIRGMGTGGMGGITAMQMQQMAAAMMQQQQNQQNQQQQNQQQQQQNEQGQQQNQQQNSMMPPPNVVLQSGYPSLVPGSMGSQQFLQALANANTSGQGNSQTAAGGAMGGGGAGNTTDSTSTGLIEALNAQIAAAASQSNGNAGGTAAASNANSNTNVNSDRTDSGNVDSPNNAQNSGNGMQGNNRNVNLGNSMASVQGGGMMNLSNMSNLSNLSNLANLNNMSNMGMLLGGPGGMGGPSGGDGGGGYAVGGAATGANNPDMIAPGDIRSGKKRVSPSVPLHPSQLQLPHHGGGILVSNGAGGAGGYVVPHSNLTMMMAGGAGMGLGSGRLDNVQEESSSKDQERKVQSNTNENQQQQFLDTLNASIAANQVNQAAALQQGLLNAALQGAGALTNYIEQSGGLSAAAAVASNNTGQNFVHSQLANQLQNQSQLQQQLQATAEATASANSAAAAAAAIANMKGQGEVLTNPSQPAANNGMDNADGNLIVRRGDVFRVPRKNMHPHPPSSPKRSPNKGGSKPSPKTEKRDDEGIVEYTVMALLGQGTFAQVFHCIERETGHCVAVKIVKNKPAYTRQAAVEIDVFRKLNAVDSPGDNDGSKSDANGSNASNREAIIGLMCYFMHCSHLCLVFEMLGPNLYELLKKRQFRGLPIGAVRTLIRQATEGIKILGKRNVVHCDLKPENILMVRADAVEAIIAKNSAGCAPTKTPEGEEDDEEQWIKLIDFGSACFEGQTMHTYIQSRFYRSPEVLIGLPYDSAIDMWSLGCVAAELFLGLPILPGVHEHDQLGRILEMIGPLPEWMLEQGTKSTKFFKNAKPRGRGARSSQQAAVGRQDNSLEQTSWEFKTRQEYISFLTEDEKQSKGGLSKLEHQPTNRYFKKKRLEDIVMHHGVCNTKKEREQLGLFVHFLKGVLDPDPWKRWTAHQASMHPFLSGSTNYRCKSVQEVGVDGVKPGAKPYDIHWVPPWDASICRRKLLVVQKTKEKSGRRRLSDSNNRSQIRQSVPEASAAPNPPPMSTQGLDIYGTPLRTKKTEPQSPATSITSQMAALADAMSLGQQPTGAKMSPPQNLDMNGQPQYSQMYPFPTNLSASLGAVANLGLPVAYQQLADAGLAAPNLVGRSFSENMYSGQQLAAAQQNLQSAIAGLNDYTMSQQLPPQQTFMGAQSYSGAYFDGMTNHQQYVESDLGYALQRPGVVPMGGEALAAVLQRQNSNPALAFLSQQNPMLSASWSNLSSTPRSYGQSSNLMGYGSATPKSPGGIRQTFQGLQDQMFDNQQFNQGGGRGGTSLLAQQLAEYSDSNQQNGQQQNSSNDNQHQYGMQQSFSSNMSGMYNSAGPLNAGSYQGSYVGYGGAAPMSLTSLPVVDPRLNPQAMNNMGQLIQSASFGDYGGGMSMQQQQQQHQQVQMPSQLSLNMNSYSQNYQDNNQDQTQNQNHHLGNGGQNGNGSN